MKSNSALRVLIILVILMLNIGCDQISKTIVREKMTYDETIGLVYNHVTLGKVENSGAFLSLGDSLSGPVKLVLLNIFPLLFWALACFIF